MEQAKNYVCKSCSALVQRNHRFCGACGAPVPQEILEPQTRFFSESHQQEHGRLVLIRGLDSSSGATYKVGEVPQTLGRIDCDISFPKDGWLSSPHASLRYQDGRVWIRNEGSVNGVYLRIRQPTIIQHGDQFLCGEQVFRFEEIRNSPNQDEKDGVLVYRSPHWESSFRVVQVLEGGIEGMVFCARNGRVTIGRDESDMNFQGDVFLSGRHATLERDPSQGNVLRDENSKNGTYLRILDKTKLEHGDYVFVGRELFRMESSA